MGRAAGDAGKTGVTEQFLLSDSPAEPRPHILWDGEDVDPSICGLVGIAWRDTARAVAVPLWLVASQQVLRDRDFQQSESGVEETHIKGLSLAGHVSAMEGSERAKGSVQRGNAGDDRRAGHDRRSIRKPREAH